MTFLPGAVEQRYEVLWHLFPALVLLYGFGVDSRIFISECGEQQKLVPHYPTFRYDMVQLHQRLRFIQI